MKGKREKDKQVNFSWREFFVHQAYIYMKDICESLEIKNYAIFPEMSISLSTFRNNLIIAF